MPTTKAHCNTCHGDTHHDILHEEKTFGSEEINEHASIQWSDTYQMLRCCGCHSIRLMHESWFSENDGSTITYYPPASARPEPGWFRDLWKSTPPGAVVEELIKEIYTALHNGSLRLAAIGVRSLLEHMMIEKVGDKGTFGRNVAAFRDAKLITDPQAEFLTTTLEAGHASTHRAWKPTTNQMEILMDLTESVIEAVYVLPGKLAELKAKIPPRSV